jgi:hypothetical protein
MIKYIIHYLCTSKCFFSEQSKEFFKNVCTDSFYVKDKLKELTHFAGLASAMKIVDAVLSKPLCDKAFLPHLTNLLSVV